MTQDIKDTNEIVFHAIPSKEQVFLRGVLDLSYTKNVLESITNIFINHLKTHIIYLQSSDGNSKISLRAQIPDRFYKKADYVNFLAQFYSAENLVIFYKVNNPKVIRFIQYLLLYDYAPSKTAQKILGENNITVSSRSWQPTFRIDEHLSFLFKQEHSKDENGYSNDIYLYLNNALEESFRKLLLPPPNIQNAMKEQLEELTTDPNILRFENEQQLSTQMELFSAQFASKQIDKSRDFLLAPTIKRQAQLLSAKEFFESTKEKELKTRSATFLINTLFLLNNENATNKKFQGFDKKVRTLYRTIFQEQDWLLELLLKDYTGVKNHVTHTESAFKLLDSLFELLQQMRENKWISIDICQLWVLNQCKKKTKIFSLVYPYTINRYKLKNKYTDKNITIGNYVKEITLPFINGFMFFLASIGFVEIAYTEPDSHCTAWNGNLKCVRLTNLGAYAMEQTNELKSNKAINMDAFALDEDRLYIRVKDENTLFMPIIEKIAERISHNLYKVSYGSFLNDCKTKKDIEEQINLFDSYICKEKPTIWDEFFRTVLERCKPLKNSTSQYKIFQLDKNDKRLLQFISTHPIIREHTVKAEHYILLVETTFEPLFHTILKKEGYLI